MRRSGSEAHILRIEKNRKGKDWVVGDVHGCAGAFAQLISQLGRDDRLFLVGDLMDRGVDSRQIIELIMKRNEECPNSVYAVQGNHEDMFMKAIDYLCWLNPEERKPLVSAALAKKEDPRAKEAPPEAVMPRASQVVGSMGTAEPFREASRHLENYIDGRNGGEWILFYAGENPDMPQLIRIYDYVKSLPYILICGDLTKESDAFIICHADRPVKPENNRFKDITDAELMDWAASNKRLDEAVINYCIWGRPGDITAVARITYTMRCAVTYCGHNAIFCDDKSFTRSGSVVNLDFSACFALTLVAINHTDGEARYFLEDSRNGVVATPTFEGLVRHERLTGSDCKQIGSYVREIKNDRQNFLRRQVRGTLAAVVAGFFTARDSGGAAAAAAAPACASASASDLSSSERLAAEALLVVRDGASIEFSRGTPADYLLLQQQLPAAGAAVTKGSIDDLIQRCCEYVNLRKTKTDALHLQKCDAVRSLLNGLLRVKLWDGVKTPELEDPRGDVMRRNHLRIHIDEIRNNPANKDVFPRWFSSKVGNLFKAAENLCVLADRPVSTGRLTR